MRSNETFHHHLLRSRILTRNTKAKLKTRCPTTVNNQELRALIKMTAACILERYKRIIFRAGNQPEILSDGPNG